MWASIMLCIKRNQHAESGHLSKGHHTIILKVNVIRTLVILNILPHHKHLVTMLLARCLARFGTINDQGHENQSAFPRSEQSALAYLVSVG